MDYMIKPLTHVVNLSITFRTFPDFFQTTKVILIYIKSKEKSNLNNYRPISLPSVGLLAKVVEVPTSKLIRKQTSTVLANCQFWFRHSKNTADALFTTNICLMDLINPNKKV